MHCWRFVRPVVDADLSRNQCRTNSIELEIAQYEDSGQPVRDLAFVKAACTPRLPDVLPYKRQQIKYQWREKKATSNLAQIQRRDSHIWATRVRSDRGHTTSLQYLSWSNICRSFRFVCRSQNLVCQVSKSTHHILHFAGCVLGEAPFRKECSGHVLHLWLPVQVERA